MPAGIVKTPNSNGNGNQKTAERNSSGKKFVQTRLPFKLITPGGSAPGAAAPSSGAPEAETQEPRKRKLSYEEDVEPEGTSTSEDHLRRSTSKENLNVTGPAATKKAKTTEADEDAMAEDVIELDDEEDEVVSVKEVAEAKEPKVTKPAKKSLPKDKQNSTKAKEKLNSSKSKESKSSPAPPIQIKLPLGNKRPKRRKSLKKSDETVDSSPIDSSKPGSESSDDIEAIAEELNPQKKPKVQENKDEDVVELLDDDQEENEEAVEKAKEASKETKKTDGNKKSIMDLFASKKGDGKKKAENKQPKEKENAKKDEESAGKEEKKVEAENKPAEKPKKNLKKSPSKQDSPKVAKEKATTVKNSKEEKPNEKNSKKKETTDKETIEEAKPTEKPKKNAEKSPKNQENSKDTNTPNQEIPGSKETLKISEEEAKKATDISVLLSSSENEQSSSDHEMEVDTDTPARSMHKDTPSRRSLPEASDGPQKNLTPKQQRLLEQRKKAREEKEQKLAEERRLKQVEKEQREQQKKQEREEKEQQRKLEKDQKEQQKKLEREEKERKRQAEVDTKNEEKRKRNEAKEEVQRKKDEERRKKEQEREEAEQKKKRAAESFSKFFVPKQPKSGSGASATSYLEHEQSSCDSTKASSQTLAFRPFQVKDDMLLAPVIRANLGQEERSQLDGLFREKQEDDEDEDEDIGRRKRPNRAHLYLSELNSGRRKPLQMQRDTRLQRRTKDEEDEDEVQVIDDLSTAGLPIEEEKPKQLARMRAKYLHFADNRRPPYYGTWRKKSRTISARRPLALDKKLFDYELDSDCEWEEEEPGESLSASEDEKERESEEESEEEYNEWYVPHGHLSDEELQNDGEMDDGHTREAQKAKLQVLQQEFAQEMKKQTKKIKPRLLGPVWLDENGNKSELFPAMFAHTIDMYACWQVGPLSLEPPPEPEREDQPPDAPVPLQLDERLLQQLVRLTHGNRNSKVFLINEYLEYLKTQEGGGEGAVLPSKTLVREKFDELASWKHVELTTPDLNTSASSAKKAKKPKKRLCWVVPPEILEKFHLPDLSLQNQWDYTLTPKITEGPDAQQHELSPPAEAAEATASPTVATATPTSSGATTPNTGGGTKKRATLLMSVPRDQPIQTAAKNALISQFLRRRSDSAGGNPGKDKDNTPTKPKGKERPPTVSEDVVMLSD
ncbi:chromatin assembly factor 1 subunit A-B [Drosophila bipectinata]|uniref:chromatin assembly factor 1 subunit A-B n=1 Tax=Drosophila bipectinata TaxID=42026 RepID=UPI001C8AFD3A|nr:chromatin assembly factor 1 subunit A-B [Drosophila bipectinata]